ncbi:hypothetical protein ACKWTF_010717 [Chironomus riparius]
MKNLFLDLIKFTDSNKQQWNQLSRFQKNLVVVVIFGGILLCGFLLYQRQLLKANSLDVFSSEHVKSMKTNVVDTDKIQIVPFKEDISSVRMIQNENQLPSADEWVQNAVDNNHDTKNSIDNPQDIINGDIESDKSEVKRDINNENEDTKTLGMSFKGPMNERQQAVVNAMRHSWTGYKTFAFGHDNLKPISQTYSDWFSLGLTIIDSLDTLYIMDMQEEYQEARKWVEESLKLDVNRDVNLFEVTIRVLGGLLSIYHLSGDEIYMTKALELGKRLMPSFDSTSGIPYSDVNLFSMQAHSPKWSPDSSTSEVTTIQLEFRDLSRISNDPTFENAITRVSEKVHELPKTDGLVPIFINANTGSFRSFSTISLGARGDSYYEYLLKQWLQVGKIPEHYFIEDYKEAINGVIKHLRRKTPNEHHVYVGELISGKDFKPKMDHLTCYLPGTLLLGHKNGMPQSHFTLANELLETCYQTYIKQATGLAPEITYFNLEGESATDIYVKANDAHNLQRPEFIESLYYFYVITGNKTYQDMGYKIFESFEKYTRVSHGYTSISNVKTPNNVRPKDMMETFWLGETLKYFYLLFSDDRNEIDLDKFIFNTEAHVIPVREN